MLTIEMKLKGSEEQYRIVDEAIRAFQFVRNKCLRFWIDGIKVTLAQINAEATRIRKNKDFPWAKKLTSSSAQAASERVMFAVRRFYENCKAGISGSSGYPKFQKNNRSVEFKVDGWRLSADRKHINFTDGFKAGRFKLVGSYDLHFYHERAIKRVRIIKRADGYYCHFVIAAQRNIKTEVTGKAVAIDVGLQKFYTDSNGLSVENPRYLRTAEKSLKKMQRRVSKKFRRPRNKGEKIKQSNNYKKACQKLGRKHLKISRQRIDFARKTASALVKSCDLLAYEDLRIRNLVKNRKLAFVISDVSWRLFLNWVDRYGMLYKKVIVPVAPHFTSINCSNCGTQVKKSLSVRTHSCPCCQLVLDRDENAARNILSKGLIEAGIALKNTVGQTEIYACGDLTSILSVETSTRQVESLKQESPTIAASSV